MKNNSSILSKALADDCDPTDPVCRAARVMAQLSHPHRLRVLCLLVEREECSVGELLDAVPLTASALSQHLAKMKDEGLIGSHRVAKNVFYALQRDDIRDILHLLHRLYCAQP